MIREQVCALLYLLQWYARTYLSKLEFTNVFLFSNKIQIQIILRFNVNNILREISNFRVFPKEDHYINAAKQN